MRSIIKLVMTIVYGFHFTIQVSLFQNITSFIYILNTKIKRDFVNQKIAQK